MGKFNRLLIGTYVLVASLARAQTGQAIQLNDEVLSKGAEAMHGGDFAAAEKWFQAAVNSNPDNADARMELGVAELRLGRPELAVEQINKSLAVAPGQRGANLFCGIAYVQMHRVEEAVAAFDREIAIDPQNAQAEMWLGVVEMQSGHPEKAVGPLDRAVELAPDDLNILEYRGKAHSEVAYASYARMAAIDPTSWHVHKVQAQMYSQQSQHNEAIAEYLEALKSVPNNSDLYEELGNEYRKGGKLTLAQQAFQKELDLSPNNPIAMYNLAKIDIETTKPEEGLAMLEKVVANYANVPATYFYLGMGEFDTGKSTEALAALEKARGMHPEAELAPRIEYELSRVYRKLGRVDESNRAINEYTRLKSLNGRFNPTAGAAISTQFGSADVPVTQPSNQN
jgi:tetratricopeptide (TPR) repeat protein